MSVEKIAKILAIIFAIIMVPILMIGYNLEAEGQQMSLNIFFIGLCAFIFILGIVNIIYKNGIWAFTYISGGLIMLFLLYSQLNS